MTAKGAEVWVNLSEKEKICDTNLFLDNVERSSKTFLKMISVDVKANIKQEIKELGGCIS